MLKLALWLKKNGFRADQVQAFLPSPMASATAMYHTRRNPLRPLRRGPGAEIVEVPRSPQQRRLHKAFLRYHDPANWAPLAPRRCATLNRADLIGNGPHQLIPLHQPAVAAPAAHPFRTQHVRPRRRPPGRTGKGQTP